METAAPAKVEEGAAGVAGAEVVQWQEVLVQMMNQRREEAEQDKRAPGKLALEKYDTQRGRAMQRDEKRETERALRESTPEQTDQKRDKALDALSRRSQSRAHSHLMRHALAFWRGYAQDHDRLSRLVHRVRAQGSTCLLRRVCGGWRAYARRARLHAHWSNRILCATNAGMQKRHLREWRQECWRSTRVQFAADALVNRQHRRELQSACSAWRGACAVSSARAQEELEHLLYARTVAKVTCRNTVVTWRTAVACARDANAWAEKQHKVIMVEAAAELLHAWRYVVVSARQERQEDEARQAQQARSAKQEARASGMAAVRVFSQMREVLLEWARAAAWSSEKKQLAQHVSRVQTFLDAKTLGHRRCLLGGWRAVAALARRASSLAHCHMVAHKNRRMVLSFRTWSLHAQERAYHAAQAARVREGANSLLLRVATLGSWLPYVHRRQRLRSVDVKAYTRWRRRALVSGYASWQQNAIVLRWLREQLRAAGARRRGRCLAQVLVMWDSWAGERRALAAQRGRLDRSRRKGLVRCICGKWRRRVLCRRAAEAMQIRKVLTVLVSWLRTWSAEAGHSKRRRSLLSSSWARKACHLLSSCFTLWQRTTSHRLQRTQKHLAIATRASQRQSRSQKLRVLHQWSHHAVYQRRLLSLGKLEHSRKCQRLLVAMLSIWRHLAEVGARQGKGETLLQRVVREFVCSRTIERWRQGHVEALASGQLHVKVSVFCSTRLRESVLRQYVAAWLGRLAETGQCHKQAADRLCRVCLQVGDVRRGQLFHRSFACWRKAWAVAAFFEHSPRRMRAKIMRAWKHVVELFRAQRHKRVQRLQANCRRAVRTTIIARWCEHTRAVSQIVKLAERLHFSCQRRARERLLLTGIGAFSRCLKVSSQQET